ncbi:MAG: response regulator transcription factor [Bacteroidota bacterium]|jgi:DNA-binding response OmpR family regulator|nr:response regulator transcription factor [Ignavibacteria bacterium]HEX2962652.1 response regulator transcription factor [Ignavibacteriales bacterium]MCU7500518.1 response regulator transcription factor [Ignavibacteria bacterium]MCU7514066.1 response regulator transcription factor [Ignavibacteria bacterium]MCU7519597.1 response regulator transcription factor [Ignavibacteria bacterium]
MRVLVVEDEKGIAEFLKDGLEEEAFAVDLAPEGRSGLQMAEVNDYDLILLDWMLPGISGIELCRQLRKEKNDTPIIFLTAKDTAQDAVFGLESGANDYIRKPFAFEELLARIRVQLRSGSEEHSILRLGGVELNLDTHQVFQGSREVILTQKEFALLEFLLRNKGKVCTRTRIIEHVWDIHFEADTSVIDVYINFLRKKLDNGSGKSFIHTVRGSGYIAREE